MKRLFFFLALLPFAACGPDEENRDVNTDLVQNSASKDGKSRTDLPEITFETKEHDFGRITQGERVHYEFAFTNTGKSSLIISEARGSCGCTVPEWPKEPVAPGAKGVIRVEFNSEGKSGMQEKNVTISTNCEPATRVIKIKADIIVAETAK